jgi:ferredoxin
VCINGREFGIPYAGAKILAIFEQNGLAIKYDCRKGQCKACAVRVTLEGETMETLACMEDAIEGMVVDTTGLQDDVKVSIPPMETKRVTTRKILKKPASEVQKANARVFRILSQAQEAALDGEWEGCADYASELLEIAASFDNEIGAVFLSGPTRDMIRDFIAVLRTSGQDRCRQLGDKLKNTIGNS